MQSCTQCGNVLMSRGDEVICTCCGKPAEEQLYLKEVAHQPPVKRGPGRPRKVELISEG